MLQHLANILLKDRDWHQLIFLEQTQVNFPLAVLLFELMAWQGMVILHCNAGESHSKVSDSIYPEKKH